MNMRSRATSISVVFALGLTSLACTPSTTPSASTPDGAGGDDLVAGLPNQTLERITVVGYTTSDLLVELERARAHLLVDKYDKAAQAFDRLMRLSKDPKITAVAMFNAGVAYEGLGKRDIAVRRYRELVDEHGDQQIARVAHLRLTRQLGYLERWQKLAEAANDLLTRKDLSVLDRIEGLGARALGLVEQGNVEAARIPIGKAQELIDRHKLGLVGIPPFQLAQVAFAEGEARRIISERIKLTPVKPNFGDVLEARCQGLLDAQ
jgi:tetratricopeptide (TPR) repeat protein